MSDDFRENPLRQQKRRKLEELRRLGYNPFPHVFSPTHKSEQILSAYEAKLQPGDQLQDTEVTIAGRLMMMRDMGKAAFFNVADQTGSLQAYVRLEDLSADDREVFRWVDLGDIVGVRGFLFKTKKGELTVHARQFWILCKSLEPLPEKFHGVTDVEIKYRHRHLDLISHPEQRQVFMKRSQIIREVRRFLDDRGFLEVETPVLQPIYGGAAAHPFTTHHRALDMQLFLRISPELYLKRLIVGGFEKVYEVGKQFRNEGIDRSHNPEFTMLEFYEAYTDYQYQMRQFEELVATVAEKVTGSPRVTYQGRELDLTPPWPRLGVLEGIEKYSGLKADHMSEGELFEAARRFGSELEKPGSWGEMVMEIFELKVEKEIWGPVMVMDFPVEISPLTKSHRDRPRLVERFEPIVAGMELGNAYTELNDPEDQRQRLNQQEALRVVNEEAQPLDEDFLLAIDTGMPPTGGVGIGIERLVMILTDQPSIRDILFFPTMRREGV